MVNPRMKNSKKWPRSTSEQIEIYRLRGFDHAIVRESFIAQIKFGGFTPVSEEYTLMETKTGVRAILLEAVCSITNR